MYNSNVSVILTCHTFPMVCFIIIMLSMASNTHLMSYNSFQTVILNVENPLQYVFITIYTYFHSK